MVLVKLTCAIVGEGLAFVVKVDDGKKVSTLKEKIKKKKPDSIKVEADALKLFLAKQGDEWMDVDTAEAIDGGDLPGLKEMDRRLWLKNQKHFGVNFAPQGDQVHVLVAIPEETESQRLKRQKLSLSGRTALEWSGPEPRTQLQVQDGDQLIRMEEAHVKGTGVGSNRYPLILFRRQGVIDEWNVIHHNVIEWGSLLWICGPTGTGKSCVALASACSLEPSLWDVVWVHYSRKEEFHCVWMQEGSKQTCSFSEDAVETLLPQVLAPVSSSSSTKAIVFLDGYVSDSDNAKRAFQICNSWRQRDLAQRRLVCVSSLAVLDKECRIDGVAAIAGPDEELLERSMFECFSWALEDYTSAIENTEFFESVQDMFPPYRPKPGIVESEGEQRRKRLEEKHFVAGGNARVMFELSPTNAVEYVERALETVQNFEICDATMTGSTSSSMINRLLAIYPVGDEDSESCLVSGYAMRALAHKLRPDELKKYGVVATSPKLP